jgi:rhodanese-related sulfurtransferase
MVQLDPAAAQWRLVEDEVVALDVRREEYFVVNASGAVLWPLLTAGTTPEALAECLTQRFDVPAERAAADVDGFLSRLRARDILTG